MRVLRVPRRAGELHCTWPVGAEQASPDSPVPSTLPMTKSSTLLQARTRCRSEGVLRERIESRENKVRHLALQERWDHEGRMQGGCMEGLDTHAGLTEAAAFVSAMCRRLAPTSAPLATARWSRDEGIGSLMRALRVRCRGGGPRGSILAVRS